MSRLVTPKPTGATLAAAGDNSTKEYFERVAKYVPSEIVAAYVTINGLIPGAPNKAQPYLTAGNFLLCPYNSASVMNEVDAALIKLDTSMTVEKEILQIGPIHGMTRKASMSPGITVEMCGRTSGYRSLEVGGIAATYSFRDSTGTDYCFQNLFELRWPSVLRVLLGRPVSGGDSGAWVCAQGAAGTEWCGMVIGEDRLLGYAAFSENITTWLEDNNYTLSCS